MVRRRIMAAVQRLLLLLVALAAATLVVVTANDAVVVASGAALGERFAAAQLAELLGNATGKAVAVVTGTVAPGARRWAVGYGASLALGVPASQLDGLGAEGFATAVLNGSTAVAVSGGRGAARGAVFGVFGLLRQLGFRFYAPDETAIPTAAAFEQAVGSLVGHTQVKPAMIWRSVESGETNGADPMQVPPTGTAAQQAQNYLWLLRARNNGMNTGFGSFPVWAGSSAHTSYTLLGASAAARAPPAELWKSHRDWFWPRTDPKAYGQLCWSNTSLVAFLTQRIQTMLRANPNATMVSISQNDNLNQCADAAELAIVNAEGAPSGPMIRAINTIAKAVGADFPDVLFHTLAYDYTEQPPKITKPLPSVVVQVASSGIGDPRIQAWGKVCRQIFVWDYWVNFKHFVMPYPNYYHLGKNIQWYHQNGVAGMYEEGDGWGSGGELDALKAYVIEEMLWDPTQVPDVLIGEFLDAYYGEGAVFVEQYMQTMHAALLDAAPYNLTNRDPPTASFLTPRALLTSIVLLKQGTAVVSTDPRRELRMQTAQVAVYYPILLRWTELRAFAANSTIAWPLEETADEALATFAQWYNASGITNLKEPDPNDIFARTDLQWMIKQVHCNCSWNLPCCQKQACCSGSPPPPPSPPPPTPSPPTPAGTVSIKPLAPPVIVNATARKVAPSGMAHFAQTLYRFPGGQLFTNFQTTCDVCVPHHTDSGRSFYSSDNGSSWTEIAATGDPADPYTNGAQVYKSCVPGNDPSWNSLTCFAYPLHIADPKDNRTASLLMSRFEVATDGSVRQVSVANATVKWPSPGLIPFAASASPGNWFMVADSVPVQAKDDKTTWLMPVYGEWKEYLLPPNTTHQNLKETSNVLALVKNTDASLTKWEFYSWVNSGQPWHCAPSRGVYWPLTPHDLCNPTESAILRLSNGKLLIVWRNDPGYNITLMAQVSGDDGQTWSLAAPMHGKIKDGEFEDIVNAPFGVEPKLQMMSSGVIVLSTGRPRMYLWSLAPGADPLTAVWQPFDQGKIHNAAVALSGSPAGTPQGILPFTDSYWKIWRGANDPNLRGTGCCTDAYTGIVPIPNSNVLVMTYDMLAFNCPKGVYSPNNVCDFIVSMNLEVTLGKPSPSPAASTPS